MTLLMLQGADGRTYYLTPTIEEAKSWGPPVTWTADGQPIAIHQTSNRNLAAPWLVSDHEVAEIVARWDGPRNLVGWRLRDASFHSEAMPLAPTLEAFEALPEHVRESGFYEGIYDPTEHFERHFPTADWTRYDGEPAPDDGLIWVVELPYALGGRVELRHLFPGYLSGFRAAAKARLERHPGLRYVFDKGSTLELSIEVGYDVPKTRWQPKMLRSGRESTSKREQVTERYTHRIVLPVPDRITGANRDAAVVEWQRRMAELDAFAVEATTVRACSHCGGKGIVGGAA